MTNTFEYAIIIIAVIFGIFLIVKIAQAIKRKQINNKQDLVQQERSKINENNQKISLLQNKLSELNDEIRQQKNRYNI